MVAEYWHIKLFIIFMCVKGHREIEREGERKKERRNNETEYVGAFTS